MNKKEIEDLCDNFPEETSEIGAPAIKNDALMSGA